MEIKGLNNTAVCYANVIEDEAVRQIQRICDQEFTAGSRIRIMPDVHVGKGCTIGTTMTVTDKIVPNLVGVDIGCGMYTVKLEQQDIDPQKVDEAAHFIPSGRNVWEGRVERFDLMDLRCYRNLKDAKRLEKSLGTLGGGNHFIEIDSAPDGTKYLIIHSGSRNLGKQVAEYYQKLAVDLAMGKGELFEKRQELIRTYKEQGRRKEIQPILRAMEKEWQPKELTMPADLCYLYGQYLEDYLHDVQICQRFAERSRKKMADMRKRCEIIGKAEPDAVVSIHQNSYHQENVSGGQVFYYRNSVKGKRLAELIQDRFSYVLGEENTRLVKSNDSYYLLLHVKEPIVIVECGFLSNPQEAKMLTDEDYQDRMAWTIHMGIMEYLNEQK